MHEASFHYDAGATTHPMRQYARFITGNELLGELVMSGKRMATQFHERTSHWPARESERIRSMLEFENRLWEQGFCCIAGVDEAGRGPLAGPVVAAAVILSEPLEGLDDSKKLTAARREQLVELLRHSAARIGIAFVGASEIDVMGIQQANLKAMHDAVTALIPSPDYILVDGFALKGVRQPSLKLIKGDSRSLSIAAASIVAKVMRDQYMNDLDKKFPEYGFEKHKGYGTRAHMDALEKYGPCPEHRRSFAPLVQRVDSAFLF